MASFTVFLLTLTCLLVCSCTVLSMESDALATNGYYGNEPPKPHLGRPHAKKSPPHKPISPYRPAPVYRKPPQKQPPPHKHISPYKPAPVYRKPPRKQPPPYKPSPLIRPPRPPYNADGGAWLPASATWYGSATGSGTDGGACGYGSLAKTPYGSRVTAGSPVLFQGGKGCGACYQVKCISGAICSARPVTVVIMDECPGCGAGKTHFDMSGTAFSGMASSIQSTQSLLNTGVVQVLYRRVPCSYPGGTTLAFQVDQGSTPYWFSMLVRYEAGDGDLSAVQLMEGGQWKQMDHLWGAYWCLNGGPLKAPFSVKITTSKGASLTAFNVIPDNWAPGQTYSSSVNF